MGPSFLLLLSLLLLGCLSTASQSYNATQASILARYSKAAYYSRPSLQSWSCPSAYCLWHVQDLIVFSGEEYNLQGFAGYCGLLQKIVVVIRGTVRKNWLQNFQVIRVDYSVTKCEKCKVHSGFSKHADSLQEGVLEAVGKLVSKYLKAEILLSGHSLGGALAQLLGLKIKKNFNVTTTLYTFESPRVGNKHLAQFSDKTFKGHFRVVNWKDAVPHVLAKKLGFKHGGTEIWYKSGGKMMVCPGDQSGKCSNSLYLMLLIDCHDLVKYITMLTPKRPSHGKGEEYVISGVQLVPKKNLKSSGPVVTLDKLEDSQAPRQQMREGEDIDGLQGYEVYSFLIKYEDAKEIGELAD